MFSTRKGQRKLVKESERDKRRRDGRGGSDSVTNIYDKNRSGKKKRRKQREGEAGVLNPRMVCNVRSATH